MILFSYFFVHLPRIQIQMEIQIDADPKNCSQVHELPPSETGPIVETQLASESKAVAEDLSKTEPDSVNSHRNSDRTTYKFLGDVASCELPQNVSKTSDDTGILSTSDPAGESVPEPLSLAEETVWRTILYRLEDTAFLTDVTNYTPKNVNRALGRFEKLSRLPPQKKILTKPNGSLEEFQLQFGGLVTVGRGLTKKLASDCANRFFLQRCQAILSQPEVIPPPTEILVNGSVAQ